MGNKVSGDRTPDGATGLSPRDKDLIRKSWAEISNPSVVTRNAIELFTQLFKAFPDMKKGFAGKFGQFDETKIGGDPKFRAHALGVMHYLTSYVQNLDDAETLVALVEKLVDAHMVRGITLKDFQDLGSIFGAYLRLTMKSKVTPEIEEAWGKLLGAQNSIFEARWAEFNKK